MWQGIRSGWGGGQGDLAHPAVPCLGFEGSWSIRDTASSALGVVATFLLLTLFAVPARAQGASSLPVAAQVIATAPSREALAAALNPGTGQAIPRLAQIRRLVVLDTPAPIGVARRPRTIVTIDFLRN